jgi:hypothetical protein
MSGSARFWTTIFALFLSALLSSSTAAVAGNCQAKLVGNSYDCNLNFSDGENVGDCLDFTSGGANNFDLNSANFGSLVCACDATGPFKSPSFDSSGSAFECVNIGVSGFEYNGKIKSKKLNGQTIDARGFSGVFECTKRSSPCT